MHSDPEVFLIDEILAVGDEPFQQKCLRKVRSLRDEGRTLVIVSHDLDMVAGLCDRGVLLESGRVRADGPTSDMVSLLRAG
ncbi:Teichoic acids export ATP-binding protein TagH [compost metagenome]